MSSTGFLLRPPGEAARVGETRDGQRLPASARELMRASVWGPIALADLCVGSAFEVLLNDS